MNYKVEPLFTSKRLKCRHCDNTYANATTLFRHMIDEHQRKVMMSLDDFICATSGPVVKKE